MKALASGDWLTGDRVMRIAWVAAFISAAAIVTLLATATGTLDRWGRPLGTDFSNVWTAGAMALRGDAADAWSWPLHHQVQRETHSKADVDFFGWHYPPPFLLVAALLAGLPYVAALVVWQLATLAPFTTMMWRLVPRPETILLVLAAPVTLICLAHGHNGFLTALLLGAGLALLDRRPLSAGILFGCLIYKPQFGLIIPALLLATRSWQAIGGAMLSAGALVAATLLIWGWPVWQAFIESLTLTRAIVIEQGDTGWHKIMSPFAAVRMWGGSIAPAYAVQAAVTAAAIAATAWVGWTRKPSNLRNALVCAAVLVSTPYVLDYDYVVLLPALAFLWRDSAEHGWLSWDKSLLAFVWLAPLVGRQAGQIALVPLVLLSASAVAAISLRRAALRSSPSHRSRAASDP